MKLQEYFTHQQNLQLSEVEKLDMYRNIMDKQVKRSFLTRRSVLHVKTFTYTSFIIVLLFGFYGVYFFQQTQSLNGDGVLLTPAWSKSLVQADYVAKVVDFAGTFYIEKDGQTIQTSNINDWDIVVLQNNAQVIFNIDTGTQAKITGPAKFTIQKKSDNNFRVNLMYGDYVEMKSLQTTHVQDVELSVDNLLVSQWSKTSPLNYQLVKQGEKRVIKNNGSQLIVMNQNSQNKTSLDGKKILAIQGNDVSLFDSFDKFAKAINDKNLSQTFYLALNIAADTKATAKSDITDTTTIASTLKPLATTEILSIADTSSLDTNVPSIAAVVPSDQKAIPTLEQTKTLENKFYPSFVQSNLVDVSVAYLAGSDAFASTLSILEARIKQVAETLKIAYQSPTGTEQEKIFGLSVKLTDLKIAIDKKFYVPPKYLINIEDTQKWVKYLSTQKFASLKWSSNEDIKKAIPASLKF